MSDLAPDPSPQLQPSSQASSTFAGPKLISSAAIVLVATMALVHFIGDGIVFPDKDQVSQDEIARRAAFAAAMPPLHVRDVTPTDRDAAIATMGLSNGPKAALAADLDNGRTHLIWMSFYDSDAEDGDVITVTSGGLSEPIRLAKVPTAVALPAPIDGFVKVTGTVDGEGGGVTVGIVTPNGPTPLAVLSVGQTISVPVSTN